MRCPYCENVIGRIKEVEPDKKNSKRALYTAYCYICNVYYKFIDVYPSKRKVERDE